MRNIWSMLLLNLMVTMNPWARGGDAGACGLPSKVDPPGTLFYIGRADGSAMEFGLIAARWPAYLQHHPKPVDFKVGKDPIAAWPYIHPSTRDTWAGGKSHTHTIRFNCDRPPEQPVFLILGLIDTFIPSQMSIAVNGGEIASRTVPSGSGSGAGDPGESGKPSSMVFPLPQGCLKAGENQITLTLRDGSWVIYDYVYLGNSCTPPETKSEDLLRKFRGGAMAGIDDIIFCARQPGKDGHWYANFGHYGPDCNRKAYGDGGKLCRLNLESGKLTVLLEDPRGGIRDPQIDYDAKRILFSYRPGGDEHYHLYESNLDGSGLKQLTDGPFDDIEPTYLASGDIVFVSSRCNRFVNCWLTPVAVLYRCNGEGKEIHAISSNNEHDNTPWPLPDGRILYTRWEYVDRSQVHFHHLWALNPDGTNQMTWFGNLVPGITMIDAKPIPDSDKVIACFSPGHGQREHDGEIAIVDPDAGPDDPSAARPVSRGANFRDPYAISEDCILAATGASIVLMNGCGQTQNVFKLSDSDVRAGLQCHEPRPVCKRQRERILPNRTHPSEASGRLILADVNYGRNMGGVTPGQIKKLLVLETLPKPINYTGGMEPLSYGGTFTLERILGTVPVEEDGSAYFELPALRSVFFVALDENDMSIKRMQSFVTVQPGETSSCAGCHEHRTQTPHYTATQSLFATRREPSKIMPVRDVPEVIDFPRDVQPILNAHCVQCHNFDKREGAISLSGDHGPMFSHSYFALTARNQVADGRNRPQSNYAPRMLGSSASPLMTKLDASHHGVSLTPLEKKTIRLWIDTGASYPGTYAALGTGMVGSYTENRLDRQDLEWAGTKAAVEAIQRRCTSCHSGNSALPMSVSDEQNRPPWEGLGPNDPRRRFSRHLLYNLTHPEKSVLLLAPLARNAGGYGSCKAKDGTEARVFENARDADYEKIRSAISEAGKKLTEIKRFDMPGFQPRKDWVREMKRYGILPANTEAEMPIDVYQTEQQYWKSLWYKPVPKLGE